MHIALPLVLFFGLPLAMLVMLKANAGIMFLAMCAGLVLLQSLDDVVVTTAGSVVPGEGEAYVRLAVVLLSIVFASLIFRETVRGGIFALHVLIVLLIGVTLWLTLPAVTGMSWLSESAASDMWIEVNNYRSLIITAGFALSLVAVLMNHARHKRHHK